MKSEDKVFIKTDNLYIVPDGDFNTREDLYSMNWNIFLIKMSKEKLRERLLIGSMHFKGPQTLGEMSFELELQTEYRNKGYGTEALKAISEWALMQKNVYELSCDVPTEYDAAVRAVNKAHFVYREGNKKTEHYSVTRPKSTWLGLYVVIGFTVGLALGLIFNSVILGLIIGMVAGMLCGGILDTQATRERENVTGQHLKDHK